MSSVFLMPPPNDLLNDEPISLDEIIYSVDKTTSRDGTPSIRSIIHINRDLAWKPNLHTGDIIRPVLWHGRLFTLMCFDNTKLISLLEQLSSQNYPMMGRNKLAACIRELFVDQYLKHNLHWMRWWWGIMLVEGEAKRVEGLYIAPSEEEKKIAVRSFDKVLNIVVAWAMADFSRDFGKRENWRWIRDIPECEVVDIGKIEVEKEEDEKPVASVVSAEELLNRKRMKALKLKVARMRAKGLIDEEVVDMLEM